MAGNGSKKAGRNVEKCKKYRSFHRRELNKVKRVLKSSGRVAAEKYAFEHGVSGYLSGLLARSAG